jgi:hypothetical protein
MDLVKQIFGGLFSKFNEEMPRIDLTNPESVKDFIKKYRKNPEKYEKAGLLKKEKDEKDKN